MHQHTEIAAPSARQTAGEAGPRRIGFARMVVRHQQPITAVRIEDLLPPLRIALAENTDWPSGRVAIHQNVLAATLDQHVLAGLAVDIQADLARRLFTDAVAEHLLRLGPAVRVGRHHRRRLGQFGQLRHSRFGPPAGGGLALLLGQRRRPAAGSGLLLLAGRARPTLGRRFLLARCRGGPALCGRLDLLAWPGRLPGRRDRLFPRRSHDS